MAVETLTFNAVRETLTINGQSFTFNCVATQSTSTGDMLKATYDPDADGIIAVAQGGTGATTAAGIRTAINVADGANNYSHPNHSGAVTSDADGAQTITDKAVTLAKIEDTETARIMGRVTAATGSFEKLTATQVRTLLNVADGATAYTDTLAKTALSEYVPTALGAISGATALNWSVANQVVTASVGGTATELTKGTGWPAANMADMIIRLTVSSTTAITWTIVDYWDVALPDSLEASATHSHQILLRSIGGVIHGLYGGGPV